MFTWGHVSTAQLQKPHVLHGGAFSVPALFITAQKKTGYSWSKLLWIFNVTLPPLEQNLFPCNANPKLFLLSLVLRGWWACLEGVQRSWLTVNLPLEWEGKEARLWKQGGGERDSPHNWLVRGLVMVGASDHVLLCCVLGRWQDVPRGWPLPERLDSTSRTTQFTTDACAPRNRRGSNLKEPWSPGQCGLWDEGSWNPWHKPGWRSMQSIYI